MGAKKLFLLLALVLMAAPCFAQELTIAAAADLQFVLPEIVSDFQKQTGIAVKTTFGSSGNLSMQIQNGAPFDLLLSADIEYPRRLIAMKAADGDSLYEYAEGRLVLWVPNGSRLDLSRGLEALKDPAVGKIAIANPAHAPYGRAAVTALQRAGLYDAVAGRIVMGEDIAQAAQFVQSGAADAGLIALSLARAPAAADKGRYVVLPQDLCPPIRQAAVIVSASPHRKEAQKFLEFLKQPATVALMKSYGFSLPR